jgi:hypothetical protein
MDRDVSYSALTFKGEGKGIVKISRLEALNREREGHSMIVTEMERGAAIFYQRFFIPTALSISRCVSWMIKSL